LSKHLIYFEYKNEEDDKAIDLAFNKKFADNRKEWILNYNPKDFIDHTQKRLNYADFINKEMV
jgi:DNA topoisomerase-2